MDEPRYFVYIVQCSDSSLYTGYTTDLDRRIAAHNQGTGAKYTKARRPVELVYWEPFSSKQEAMSAEWHYKKKSRLQKLEMIKKFAEQTTEKAQEQ